MMSIPTGSITRLPDDILGKIATHCDVRTLYAFRGTCQAANAIGKDCMSEEVAARVIFHNPERYRTLRLNALKESRKVAINALTNLPELFLEPSFPEQFRTDKEMLKTAFVAAKMLKKEEVASEIHAMAPKGDPALKMLDQHIETLRQLRPSFEHLSRFCHTTLLQYAPFVLHATIDELSNNAMGCMHNEESGEIPESITHNIDIVCEAIKKRDFRSLFPDYRLSWMFWDNEEFARVVLPKNPHLFKYLSARLQDTDDIADMALRGDMNNSPYLSDRLRNDFTFVNRHIGLTDGLIFRVASDRIRRSAWSSYRAVFKNLGSIQYVLFESTPRLQKAALSVSIVFGSVFHVGLQIMKYSFQVIGLVLLVLLYTPIFLIYHFINQALRDWSRQVGIARSALSYS